MSNAINAYSGNNELFGPINAGEINPSEILDFSTLFQINNWTNDKFRDRPTIIFGRRGSGKTHYLRQILFDQQYDYYVEIQATRVLRYVSKIVQVISKDIFFIEMVEDVWEIILWVAVFSEFRKRAILNPNDLALIESYLRNIGVRENADVDETLLAAANYLSERMSGKHEGEIIEPIKYFGDITFKDVRNTVEGNLRSSQKKLVIIIDSMQDIQLDISSVERALQGLLKFIGAMNKPRDVVDVRFCLPLELYPKFENLSLNPIKDFQRAFNLQWDERELVRIGAQRLFSHLTSYYPEFCKKIISFDLKSDLDSLMLFDTVFPKHIYNRFGHKEETIYYLLRHTQFVPRHFLILLNSIFINLTNAQSTNPFPISGEHILTSIQQTERILLREIILPFKSVYPAAEQIYKRCLSVLGQTFSIDNLKRVFKDHGKTIFGDENFDEFQNMLLEVGVIGRVIPGISSDVYIRGDFKYTTLGQFPFNQKDKVIYCVHPLFSDIFQSAAKQERPVFPSARLNAYASSDATDDAHTESPPQQNYSLPFLQFKTTKKVFISYRRSDSADIVGRIYDRLVQKFGNKSVFKDVDSMALGLDFRDQIDDAVKNCDVCLAIIGTQWLDIKNSDGTRRLADPKDFVRIEIESALKRKIPVVPIFVQGASMPHPNKLPRSIKELAFRNGLEVRPDPDFHKDMDRLIKKL